jgi:hypothetical protein
MRFLLETITPARAKKYLLRNVCNRRIRPTWVDKLARQILEGRWVVTHQGIAFDEEGRLLDGQHRLSAIVAANKSVKMWVAYDEPGEARLVVDSGGARDVLDISGSLVNGDDRNVTTDEVSTARQMFCSVARANFSLNTTNQEKLLYLIRHREAIQFACDNTKSKEVKHACLRAPIARAWYTEDRERLLEFCRVLCSGIAGSKEDVAAAKLRSYYTANKVQFNGAGGRATLYRKVEMALRAFLARKPITQLSQVESEAFPIPGDGDSDGDSSSLQDIPGDGAGSIRGADGRHGQAWAARPYRLS